MCLCSVPGPSGSVGGGGGGDLTLPMVLMGWVVVVLVLFLLRPSSLRGSRPTGKPTGPHNVSTHHAPFYITNNVISDVVTAPPWFALALKASRGVDNDSQCRRENLLPKKLHMTHLLNFMLLLGRTVVPQLSLCNSNGSWHQLYHRSWSLVLWISV